MNQPADAARPRRTHGGLRWSLATVILIIGALLVPVTLVARYARGELLNTDRYVATVAPLASDPAVQSALTDRVTTEIINKIDVPALINDATEQFNGRAAPAIGSLITGPVTDWLNSFVHKHVQDFVTGPKFETLWTQANRLAHQGVDTVLTGEQGGVLGTSGDAVVLNIGPIVDAAKQALIDDGFSVASKIPPVTAQFTLFESDQVPKAQGYVRLLNTLANWLPWLTLLVLAFAVWIAPNRRRAAVIGLAIAGVVLALVLIANYVVRDRYAQQVSAAGRSVDAGLAVYDAVVRSLLAAAWTALAACVVAGIWAWLAGPGRVGTGLRRLVGRLFQRIADGLGWHRSQAMDVFERYRGWLYLVLGVLALALLLNNPTAGALVWIVIAALVLTGVVAVLHRLPRRAVRT